MQMPVSTTPISRCESLAHFLAGTIRRYVVLFAPPAEMETKLVASAVAIESGIDAVSARQTDYRRLVLACIAPRVEVKLVDLRADSEVRSCKRSAEDAGKDVAFAVFPEGTTPIIKPVGQSEVDALRSLEGRILAAAAHWPASTDWHARIVAVRTLYETALENRKNAMSEASTARAMRNATKEEFLDVYAATAGTIKALFPRDRAVQDIFFDEVRSAGDADADEEPEPALG